MGIFEKVGNAISKAASTVGDVVGGAVEWVKGVGDLVLTGVTVAAIELFNNTVGKVIEWAIGAFLYFIYDPTNMASRKAAEVILEKFISYLKEPAMSSEKAIIDSTMSCFDDLEENVKESFPEIAEFICSRKEMARQQLPGIMIDHIKEHISLGNLSFTEILMMTASLNKKQSLSKYLDNIIREAKEQFEQRVESDMESLNDEIKDRLFEKVNAQEGMLQDTVRKYEELLQQQLDGGLNIHKIEAELVPAVEAASGIQHILGQGVS